jgi:transposase
MFLTDEQWSIIEPHLKIERKSVFGCPMADTRKIFEALLFVVHTGMQWEHLPRSFPPKSTVHDYLKRWCQRDRFRRLLAALIRRLLRMAESNLIRPLLRQPSLRLEAATTVWG